MPIFVPGMKICTQKLRERLSIGVCPKEFPSFYKYNREKKEPSQTVLYGPGFPCFDMLQ